MEEKIKQLEDIIDSLRLKVASLERELSEHNKSTHLYQPHWQQHEARDSYRFLRIPIFSESLAYIPSGRAYYRSDNNTLNVNINGTNRTSTFT